MSNESKTRLLIVVWLLPLYHYPLTHYKSVRELQKGHDDKDVGRETFIRTTFYKARSAKQ